MTDDECRREFELWCIDHVTKDVIRTYHTGRYANTYADIAWRAWQQSHTKPEGVDIANMPAEYKDGRRLRLWCEGIEYHGWYEGDEFGWIGMDEHWNLVKLNPVHYATLTAKE